ncbi:hypothetical protein [Vandammella animalimorsus]|uniref:hypothetical protein n=1 Tax=Vandammella animalimorsus TaxID=2029117 RepID=UPI0011785D95|nr:hypothetical protein [Vandammella animalimorsus]
MKVMLKRFYMALICLLVFFMGFISGAFLYKKLENNEKKLSALRNMNYFLSVIKNSDCRAELRSMEFLMEYCRLDFSFEGFMADNYFRYKRDFYLEDLNFAASYRLRNPMDELYFSRCDGVDVEGFVDIVKCWDVVIDDANNYIKNK